MYCNLPSFGAVSYQSLFDQISYLQQETQQPCDAPAHTCVRVSCSLNTAVYLCNDVRFLFLFLNISGMKSLTGISSVTIISTRTARISLLMQSTSTIIAVMVLTRWSKASCSILGTGMSSFGLILAKGSERRFGVIEALKTNDL